MSGAVWTTSKPGASCVVPTLGAVVAVLTTVSVPVGYPGFKIPGSASTTLDLIPGHSDTTS